MAYLRLKIYSWSSSHRCSEVVLRCSGRRFFQKLCAERAEKLTYLRRNYMEMWLKIYIFANSFLKR